MKYSIKKLERNIIRKKISSRGGGVEITLDEYGFKGEKMAAYQNYLGGGLLGKVCVNDTITSQSLHEPLTDKQYKKLENLGEVLKRYFHDKTNPDGEWETQTYEENQRMPVSAY